MRCVELQRKHKLSDRARLLLREGLAEFCRRSIVNHGGSGDADVGRALALFSVH